jgi:hypothetical protein
MFNQLIIKKMQTENQEAVLMTAEEKAQFEAFRQAQAKKEAEAKKKNERDTYRQLVSETVDDVFPDLMSESDKLAKLKQGVYDKFRQALELKTQIFGVKGDQRSNTFTNAEGTRRITLGNYVTDGYVDTAEDGIAIVKEFLQSFAKDEQGKALINTILRLLSRDMKGNLKASRVLQLRRTAEDLGNERLLEGVRIIEESYRPEMSKQYVRAEHKDKNGAWTSVPLGMTES